MPSVSAHAVTTLPSRSTLPIVSRTIIDTVLAGMSLRDYQREAVYAYFARPRNHTRVKVISIPTGGGKTLIGVAVVACLLKAGFKVVWVCKRWKLLRMAVEGFCHQFPNFRSEFRRIGGASRQYELGDLPDKHGGKLVFTTLQSWYKRRLNLSNAQPQSGHWVAVWDEVHWGFRSPVGQAFRNAYLPHATVLGLTATPPESKRVDVVYEKTFAELVGTVLATPVIESIPTAVDWNPELDSRQHDYSAGSLDALARHPKRNILIVEKIANLRSAGQARHILVFAVNIEHAKELVSLLATRNIPARMVHSKQSQQLQDEAINSFREGKIDVLVNVAMLTEGFDFPPIDAVLLTRPTRSNVLLTQMIGRGARKAPGKDKFHVLDFADNLTRYGDGIVRAGSLMPTFLATPDRHRERRLPVVHTEPTAEVRFENYLIAKYGSIPIALWQTFGVEIELTSRSGIPSLGPAWRAIAQRIIERLKQFVTAPVHPTPLTSKEGPLTSWRVVYDASAGWEIVSPILMNADGFNELQRACQAISSLTEEADNELYVNYTTGLHITLATRLDSDEKLRGFVKLVQRLEPGLFTVVAPSRLYAFDPESGTYARQAGNQYCRPLRGLGNPDKIDLNRFVKQHDNRYQSVNLNKFRGDIQLLEVRMHSGTYEFHKIALWISLWMQIFNTARYRWNGSARPGLVLPGRNCNISLENAKSEDIISLLNAEGIKMTPEFAHLLKQRRAKLRRAWKKVMPHRVNRWEAAGWYE